MIAVDIGAHHGIYTLLMSHLVGPQGRVIAFEPSAREFRKLKLHLKINRCSNVTANNAAVADSSGTREFFVVQGTSTVANSLHPAAGRKTIGVPTRVSALDDYLSETRTSAPDFIKLDAEGAEPQVIWGARELLNGSLRPIVLCEVDEGVISLGTWEHSADSVLQLLESRRFLWFALSPEGGLRPVPKGAPCRGDYVAVPAEKLAILTEWMRN